MTQTFSMYPALQSVTEPSLVGWLSIASDAAIVLLCLIAGAALIWAVLIMREVRGAISRLTRITGKLGEKVDPVIERSRTIAQNVEYVSASVRSDVERVTDSVQALSDRLQQASDRMEERIEEFNALMEVVQGEAEATFIDTASTVRGVRAGARELTGTGGSRSGKLKSGGDSDGGVEP